MLRHQHASSNTSRVVFANLNLGLAFATNELDVGTTKTITPKPVSQASLLSAHLHGGGIPQEPAEVSKPDVRDREASLVLAKMANSAYTDPHQSDEYDIGLC